MKADFASLRRALVVVGVTGIFHFVLAQYLAGTDTVKVLAETRDPGVLTALTALLVARLLLLFVAPGWLLYRAVAIALSWRGRGDETGRAVMPPRGRLPRPPRRH